MKFFHFFGGENFPKKTFSRQKRSRAANCFRICRKKTSTLQSQNFPVVLKILKLVSFVIILKRIFFVHFFSVIFLYKIFFTQFSKNVFNSLEIWISSIFFSLLIFFCLSRLLAEEDKIVKCLTKNFHASFSDGIFFSKGKLPRWVLIVLLFRQQIYLKMTEIWDSNQKLEKFKFFWKSLLLVVFKKLEPKTPAFFEVF